jgi:hypothetical protein
MWATFDNFAATTGSDPAATSNTVGAGDAAPPVDRTQLTNIAGALENMDVLSGALDNFHNRLRGRLVGDGVTVPQPPGSTPPTPFFPIRAGYMRILRLRLVDGFGQFVDLAGSSDKTSVESTQILTSVPLSGDNVAGLVALAPRFTSPARLWLRFLDATDDSQDAVGTASPTCGFLMPNHLDGDLEFFDENGVGLGFVRPDPRSGIVWEEAPGQPSTLGQSPSRSKYPPAEPGALLSEPLKAALQGR